MVVFVVSMVTAAPKALAREEPLTVPALKLNWYCADGVTVMGLDAGLVPAVVIAFKKTVYV
jgi:hypothetical protein